MSSQVKQDLQKSEYAQDLAEASFQWHLACFLSKEDRVEIQSLLSRGASKWFKAYQVIPECRHLLNGINIDSRGEAYFLGIAGATAEYTAMRDEFLSQIETALQQTKNPTDSQRMGWKRLQRYAAAMERRHGRPKGFG